MTKTTRLSLLMAGFVSLAAGCEPGEPTQEPASLATHEAALTIQGTWKYNATMSAMRESHTATLLSSGEVLVAGGRNRDGAHSSAEVYNPYDNTWRPTGAMTTPRLFHTATILGSGKVLVTGGSAWPNTPFLNTAELYDPATGTWRPTSNAMAVSRGQHTATRLPSGKVLVTGGTSSYSGTMGSIRAELYDPETDTWSPTGDMNHSRVQHTATLLSSGKVLVVGGLGASSSAELYDPATGTWSLTATPLQSHSGPHAMAELYSGLVLVVGEGLSELYNPYTNTWTEAPPCRVNRADRPIATRLYSGEVLVTGQGLDEASLYDPGTNQWLPTARPPIELYTHEAVLLHTGEVLIPGGKIYFGATNYIYIGPTERVLRFKR